MSQNAKSRRERAAEARGAAQSAEKKRERLVRIVGGATVVAVMAAIIGVAVYASSNSDSTSANSLAGIVDPDPEAATPATVFGADAPIPFGVPYGTATADAPVLELWEDFQCPACGSLEVANGAGIEQLAEEGKVQLVYRPTAFLDGNLGNDSSHRAIAAWGCAIDAGALNEFHQQVYANQPVEEGMGWTDDELIAFGSTSGLDGSELETFTQCVNDGTYLAWAANATEQFYLNQIPGTPSGFLNGEVLGTEILADQIKLTEAVESK
ncbi:MAG: DsbA family protein [Candidatus Nanopelagicales bacterium]|nr:DsbA family protein [Candidatus Nanopelagicales bacterium]MCF8539155.1 DsbA family protein [Candidatus Nanopelagicales bacterium]MCF8550490.1 DsbA family protein [Candidatus Nanopelagicales bacterium]